MIIKLSQERSRALLSDAALREWQRYSGYSLKILETLEHSGGKTTRQISDAIGWKCNLTKDTLRRMLKVELVERVERWGWRITVTGVSLLYLNYSDRTEIEQRQNRDTTATQEKEEPAPKCFALTTCHIKQVCTDKRYTLRNRAVCNGTASCIWTSSTLGRVPVEMKLRGVTIQAALMEEMQPV